MRFLETVMGIPMSIDVRCDDDPSDAAERAFQVLRDADHRFSGYRTDSELSRMNDGDDDLATASDEFRDVVAIGTAVGEASGGAFRIRRRDGSWDLDGVVKGWAGARAARELARTGLRHFCLNLGGDVVVSGSPRGGEPWNVGVRSPADPQRMLAVLAVSDAAVATSGAYERGAHIVDGRGGGPATRLQSATVVADDLTTADVLATAVFALGPEGVPWARGQGAQGVLAVDADGQLLTAGRLTFAAPGHAR